MREVNPFRRGLRSPGVRLIALLGALAALAVACSQSDFVYVSSSDRKAYFKVPADWKFFDKRDILVASGQSLSGETNRQLPWLIAFDASPKPSLDNVLALEKPLTHPVVEA